MDMEFRNCKLELDLKCHAPIIHFQPSTNAKGATLRASEVKPKFDKYIWTKEPEELATYELLPYKMKFIEKKKEVIDEKVADEYVDIPLYYAKDQKRMVITNPRIVITCFDPILQKLIVKHIKNFFIVTNFGAAQGKGYGSFTIDSEKNDQVEQENIEKILMEEFGLKTLYKIDCNKLVGKLAKFEAIKKIFRIIENFYKIIKGGINHKEYIKGFLFIHMNEKGIKNEKVVLKTEIIDHPYASNQNKVKQEPKINSHKECYVRALLGLSSSFAFKDQRRQKGGAVDVNIKISHADETIERFPSPLTFKVINKIIYIIPKQIDEQIWNQKFIFTYELGKDVKNSNGIDPKVKPEELELYTPDSNEFCLEDFLEEAVSYYNKEVNKIKGPQIVKYHPKGDE
ncbi:MULTISPECIES: hypothetical protein [Streptococcus]|jgi:hypothetical protein|uniref:Uncharacterized protein n=2 Tax=Streptococcus TaxID=1301 RepID=A0A428E6K4_STRMT|nr:MULTISPECIES: hypothetical protein [Streptococcus]KXT61340.1 hypothetical protein SORDD05_00286 [Streptococcus oralis]MBZ2085083.1 hypothetical protein [Streptococcus oralis]MBZ2088140.1 hypothetical protein [Streptococcus oralis]MCY7103462.1 hypothetical protein [Streptococcus oralis]RSJ05590.1 hypothetical protein D8838_02665 [Streptococcus mitis]